MTRCGSNTRLPALANAKTNGTGDDVVVVVVVLSSQCCCCCCTRKMEFGRCCDVDVVDVVVEAKESVVAVTSIS